MFSGVKANLARRGYFLLSCSVFEQRREAPETEIVDVITGKVFTAFDNTALWDRETETCYSRFRVDPRTPDVGPEAL